MNGALAWARRSGAIALVITALTLWWLLRDRPHLEPAATLRESVEGLSMAATGDSMIVRQWPAAGTDPGFDGVSRLLQQASFAVTNLEQVLGASSSSSSHDATRQGWPIGSPTAASDLRRIGFTIVTRANNHAADRGAEGLQDTHDALVSAGLLDAGAGMDLDAARAPAYLGTSPQRIAIIAVTASARDEAHATRTRDAIRGRPGVSALRYAAEITADPGTYAALAQLANAEATNPAATSFRLSGRVVRKGATNAVALVPDPGDRDDILATIALARAQAEVVVVSIHSHEPGNLSQTPAAFIRDLAHGAIDRGATVVLGSGPRQLRGIEIYKQRPIFYSLGNFAFDAPMVPPGAGDAFDANTNLNQLALDDPGQANRPTLPSFEDSMWWESIVATVHFDGQSVKRVRLDPIDLGTDAPLKDRGRPRQASRSRADQILQRVAELSKEYGTAIRIDNGVGLIETPF